MTAVFAIPGDMHRKTGGFIYEATVLRCLNEIGCPTRHLVLPDAFPAPDTVAMDQAIAALSAVPADQPIILDGLVFGAIDPVRLGQVAAPVIAMIHHPLGLESGIDPARARHLLANEAAALRHAAHIVVPSPHTAQTLVGQFGANPQKITVAPPGFEPVTTARHPVDPPMILSVGLLARRKGHDVLLASLAQLIDLDWQADVIGKRHDPVVADELQAQVRALGLAGRVRFLGEVPDAQVSEAFGRAAIFALATRYEGYGMVLGEAMQHGLPIVSCDTGAVADTVGDAGLLVPPDDPAAFSAALRDVLTDAAVARPLAQASRLRGAGLPTWRDTARTIADVIAQVSK